jgi:hypothetical protein
LLNIIVTRAEAFNTVISGDDISLTSDPLPVVTQLMIVTKGRRVTNPSLDKLAYGRSVNYIQPRVTNSTVETGQRAFNLNLTIPFSNTFPRWFLLYFFFGGGGLLTKILYAFLTSAMRFLPQVRKAIYRVDVLHFLT